jgi:hypothetical protein
MNDQLNNYDILEGTDKDTNKPQVNSDPFIEKFPPDTAIIPETSMDETVVHAMPNDETIVQETLIEEAIVPEKPISVPIVHEAPIVTNVASSVSLLNREESEHFRTRWNEIQGRFVDEPRAAVEQADALVSEVIELITQMFNNEHRSLEGQWNQGNEVSTEDLRTTLQHYRSFFNSLVV